MVINPLHNNVLIEVIKEKKTSFGLIIPEIETEKVSKGFVKAVGPGFYDLKCDKIRPVFLKKGDCVIFNRHNAIEFVENCINYVLVSEDDIYGIIL